MASAIALQSPSGVILIEIGDAPALAQSSSEGIAGAADLAAKLEDVATTVADVCRTLHRAIVESLKDARPASLELEFGVTLAGEAGVPLVTKGTAECSFKVTAKWGD
jgi:hypothetical protein